MRFTASLLGFELDVTFGPTDAPSPAPDDEGAALNGGTTASTPMGFVAHMAAPPELPVPDRLIPWDPEDE